MVVLVGRKFEVVIWVNIVKAIDDLERPHVPVLL